MSRYATRQPFTLAADYVCIRTVTINGHTYAPGEPIPAGAARDRVLRSLYDSRKIDIAGPTQAAAKPAKPKKAKAPKNAPAAPADAPSAATPADTATDATAQAPAPAADATAADTAGEPAGEAAAAPTGHRVKQAGLGGFKVIAPSGEVIGQGWPTYAEALTEAQRLDAL
jgi:hypothetical protein